MRKISSRFFWLCFLFCLGVFSLQADAQGLFDNFQRAVPLQVDKQGLFDSYLDLGITALKSGNTPEAAKYFDKCAEISPDNYLIWLWRGVFINENNPDLAEQAFEKAIKLAPHEPDPYAMRGYLRLKKAESTNTLQGLKYLLDGMEDIDKALSLDPNNIPACFHKASALFRYKQHERYDEAVTLFKQVLKNTLNKEEILQRRYSPDYRLLAYMGLCMLYNHIQAFEKALENIDMAIELVSKSEEVKKDSMMETCYRLRYQANYQINKRNAVTDIEKIIEHNPSSLRTLTQQKIFLLLELELNTEAKNLCRTMIKTLNMDDSMRLGYIYLLGFICNEMEEATKHLDMYDETKLHEYSQKGLIQNDELRFFHVARCFMNIARNKFDEAYQDNAAKIDLEDGSNPQSHIVRALILLLMDKKEEARNCLDAYLPLLYADISPPLPLSEIWVSEDNSP